MIFNMLNTYIKVVLNWSRCPNCTVMFGDGESWKGKGKNLSSDGWVGRGMRSNRTVICGGGSLRFSHFRNEWKYQKLVTGQSKRLCSMCAVVKNGGGREEWRIATVLFGYGSNLTGNSRSHSNPPYPSFLVQGRVSIWDYRNVPVRCVVERGYGSERWQ